MGSTPVRTKEAETNMLSSTCLSCKILMLSETFWWSSRTITCVCFLCSVSSVGRAIAF